MLLAKLDTFCTLDLSWILSQAIIDFSWILSQAIEKTNKKQEQKTNKKQEQTLNHTTKTRH